VSQIATKTVFGMEKHILATYRRRLPTLLVEQLALDRSNFHVDGTINVMHN
jgi:hypothetical protein